MMNHPKNLSRSSSEIVTNPENPSARILFAQPDDDLANRFSNPSRADKAGVWWRWIDGNVSREGITRDLTEMARQGIHEMDLFDVSGAPTIGGIAMMEPEWRAMFQYALEEAARLGVSINVVPAAGWGMGGPWIGIEHATKTLAYREIQADGPRWLDCVLPAASGPGGYYQDVLVVAFPSNPATPVRPLSVLASSVAGGYCDEYNHPPEEAVDDDPETAWYTTVPFSSPVTLDVTFPEPLTAVSVYIAGMPGAGMAEGELQASDDGMQYRFVSHLTLQPGEQKLTNFEPVTASRFRLLITRAHAEDLRLSVFQILRTGDEPQVRPGIKWWKFKSGNRGVWDWPHMHPARMLAEEYDSPDTCDCLSTDILDLTDRLSPDGRLRWDVPAGRWTIIRFGMVLVGEPPRSQSRAVPDGGYEVDPYSTDAADALYDCTARILIGDTPPPSRKALTGLFIDSYEIGASARGQQGTWTKEFRATFRRLHGYDLLPWLPVLARRVVDSRQTCNRFLWDYRQTLSSLYNDFYAQWTRRANDDGLIMRAENGYGSYPFPHIDGLSAGGRVDVPVGEFWFEGGGNPWGPVMSQHFYHADSVRTAASAAHIYGKPLVGAEALTIADGISQSPGNWKREMDAQFCNGLNQVMFHLWSHQYDVTARPGLVTFDTFNANMTWWNQSGAVFDYIGRCQFLLRQGMPVADLAYFIPEESCSFVPNRKHILPAIPDGFEFDGLNAEVLLSRASCRDGRLCLPDGVSYRYLVLPDQAGWRVTIPVLERMSALVREGITLIGTRPGASPGLRHFSEQDQRIQQIADDLWGIEPDVAGVRTFGKGRVIWGSPLTEIFFTDGLPPDLALHADTGGESHQPNENKLVIAFLHRCMEGMDCYFLSNQGIHAAYFDATFRVTGRRPEIWDPLSGSKKDLIHFRMDDQGVTVSLALESGESTFVVFRRPVDGTSHATGLYATMHTSMHATMYAANREQQDLVGPWTVQFDRDWLYPVENLVEGASNGELEMKVLADWSSLPEPAFRYYSGTAVYRTRFEWAVRTAETPWHDETELNDDTHRKVRSVHLHMGTVHEIARVRLNGKELGVVWCAPWRIDATDALIAGDNLFEIEVANLWVNRLYGDGLLSSEHRRTRTNQEYYYQQGDRHPDLLPSGLLGPVRLIAAPY